MAGDAPWQPRLRAAPPGRTIRNSAPSASQMESTQSGASGVMPAATTGATDDLQPARSAGAGRRLHSDQGELMAKLIGLTGPARGTGLGTAGCGKDTAAAALVKAGWTRDAFADRMRTAILALDPFVPTASRDGETRLSHLVDYYGWDDAKREFPEVRRLLQKFGTEAGRDIHGKDCWVDALFSRWIFFGTGLVVTDCRFENEAESIRERGGRVVSIVRPGLAALDGGNSAHASESGLPPELIDYTIYNNSTIEWLHGTILKFAGTI